MAGADNEVHVVEVELLDGGGEKGEQGAVVVPCPRAALEEGRSYSSSGDRRRRRASHVEQCEAPAFRVEFADCLERAFASAHAGEPVMNYGYSK